jgi:DNA invertase Pin-like site-specific DNA recombinase
MQTKSPWLPQIPYTAMATIASVDHRLTQTDGKLVGYARVSTDDQDCAIQITTLKRLGCKKIYTDQISGRRRERAQLAACLDYLREGDVLAITRVDRLGRSLADLIKIADELRQRDVSLYIAQQNIDTATPMGQMFYAMLGVFAEFEYHLKRERQVEGIARATTAGRYKGRKPLDAARIEKIRRMRADGLRPADIARQLRLGRTSVYKYLNGIHPAAEQPAT